MANKIQSIRGMSDLFHQEMESHSWVIDKARDVAVLYGFLEVSTPILERTEVFSRPFKDRDNVLFKAI